MQRTVGLVGLMVVGGLSSLACVAHVYPEEEYPVYPYPEAEVYVEPGGYYHHGYRHEEHERRERHARHEHERHEHERHR